MDLIGPLYVTNVKYPHRKPFPIVEKGWSNEIEFPFRRGSCLVFRLPFTRPGIVIGFWGHAQDEDTALTSAILGREMDVSLDEIWEWS
jgi:hypothetical protein